MLTRLVFSNQRDTTLPKNLVFGGSSGEAEPLQSIAEAFFSLGSPSIVVNTHIGMTMGGVGALPSLSTFGAMQYDSNTQRPVVAKTTLEFSSALTTKSRVLARGNNAGSIKVEGRPIFNEAEPARSSFKIPFLNSTHLWSKGGSVFERASGVPSGLTQVFSNALSASAVTTSVFQIGGSYRTITAQDFQNALRGMSPAARDSFTVAVPLGGGLVSTFSFGFSLYGLTSSLYQRGAPAPYTCLEPTPPVLIPCWNPKNGLPLLFFSGRGPGSANLLFFCGVDPTTPVEPIDPNVPVQKVYFIVNELQMSLLDGTPIEVFSANVGIDRRSWSWSLSAEISVHDLEKVETSTGSMVEVKLVINEVEWRFLIEDYSDRQEFGSTTVTIGGRSPVAILDAPYAPLRTRIQSSVMSNRQYAESELSRNGYLNPGYIELDWMLPDEMGWELPVNTYNYTNKSPMAAIKEIVEGSGGYVNAHNKDRKLIVRPEYETPFWEWEAQDPEVILPHHLIYSMSKTNQTKPLYNGVWVAGTTAGYEGLVRKRDTIGDYQSPTPVTSPFMTSEAGILLMGRNVLSSGGVQASMNLTTPLSSLTGMMRPGTFIQVVNGGVGNAPSWKGVVRSTAVTAQWQDRALSVSQSIGVERHYGGFPT